MKEIRAVSIWRIAAFFLIGAVLAGCGGGGGDDEKPTMRTLHIIAGNGSLAYFQLLWPQVEVAQGSDANFAVIEPASAGHLFAADASGNKEWLATSYAPWIDQSGKPFAGMQISAFVSGTNQTHTSQPDSNYALGGNNLIAGIASYQSAHGSFAIPVMLVGTTFFGTAPGAPASTLAADAAGMIGLYQGTASADFTPTAAELTQFGIPGANAALDEFGRRLIVAAKALREGKSATIVLPFINDDPHSAFTDIPALQAKLLQIQKELNGFHDLLQDRADGVVITIGGDTPKTPLNKNGWGDGTPGNSNWIYVVGQGYLKQGWFGRVHVNGTVSSYDPTTGADDPNRTSASTEPQTAAAIAYAGTRGDSVFVRDTLSGGDLSTYVGVVR